MEPNRDDAIPCQACGHPENPPESRFCGRCGAWLERPLARELVPRAEGRVVPRRRFLPDRLLSGPVARTVAVSLAVVAADVGLAWLRHRLKEPDPPPGAGVVPPEGSGGDPEYLRAYLLREASLLLWDGREMRGGSYSETVVRSSREAR